MKYECDHTEENDQEDHWQRVHTLGSNTFALQLRVLSHFLYGNDSDISLIH